VAAGAGRRGLGPRRGSARWPAGQLVHQHRRASRLCAVGPDQRRGRERPRCRPVRWAGQQLFREHPGAAGYPPQPGWRQHVGQPHHGRWEHRVQQGAGHRAAYRVPARWGDGLYLCQRQRHRAL
jgi:hypothetical protein